MIEAIQAKLGAEITFFEHIDHFYGANVMRGLAKKNIVEARFLDDLKDLHAQLDHKWSANDPFPLRYSLAGFTRTGDGDRILFDDFWAELDALAPQSIEDYHAAGTHLRPRFPVLLSECVPPERVYRHSEDVGRDVPLLFHSDFASQIVNPLSRGLRRRLATERGPRIEAFLRGIHAFKGSAHPYSTFSFNHRVAVKERFCRLFLATQESLRPGMRLVFKIVTLGNAPFDVLDSRYVPLTQLIEIGVRVAASPNTSVSELAAAHLGSITSVHALKAFDRLLTLAMNQKNETAAAMVLAFAIAAPEAADELAKWLDTRAWKKLPEVEQNGWTHVLGFAFIVPPVEGANERILACGKFLREDYARVPKLRREELISRLSWNDVSIAQRERAFKEALGDDDGWEPDGLTIEAPAEPEEQPCPLIDEPPTPPPRLFPFRDGELWGYMDNSGRTRFEAQFETASHFHQGLAIVKRDGRTQLIDEAGVLSPLPELEICSTFIDGVACVRAEHYGVIDRHGRMLVPTKHRDVAKIGGGRIVFQDDDRAVAYDLTGVAVFSARHLDQFHQGVAFGHMGERMGFFDLGGQLVIDHTAAYSSGFNGGRAVVDNSACYGVIDWQNHWIVPFREGRTIRGYSEGLAATWNRDKWGFFNHDGELVISYRFHSVSAFSEGLCMVTDARGMHYITKTGELAVENVANGGGDFRGGLAPFANGYINTRGEIVKEWAQRT